MHVGRKGTEEDDLRYELQKITKPQENVQSQERTARLMGNQNEYRYAWGIKQMDIIAPRINSYLNDCKATEIFDNQTFSTKILYPINWTPVSDEQTLI